MEKIVLILGITVLVIAVFKKFKLPPIVAYLLIGVVFGPYGAGLLTNTAQIQHLAEIGVVFLLFTIGLELPLSKFLDMRYNLLLLGGGQVVLCTIFITLILMLFKVNFLVSFIVAFAMSLSSTAIIMRQLSEQNELFSPHGELAFTMLIFQDIAVIPVLIIMPVIATFKQLGADNGMIEHMQLIWQVLVVLLKGSILFVCIIIISKTILKKLLHQIALTRSLELFMFTVLFLALLSAYVTQALGLSMTLGAFVAGIGLGESEYRHQIDAEIRPFRDILLGIFFISIGMLLNLSIVVNKFSYVIFAVITLILIKFLVVSAFCYLFGKKISIDDSVKTGLIMAHAGEFGLAILTLAASYSVIEGNLLQILLAAMILSLFFAVFLTKYTDDIISFFARHSRKSDYNDKYPESQAEHAGPMIAHYPEVNNHVVICGFGRVGMTLAKFLHLEDKSYLGLEYDANTVEYAVINGFKVYYGDATRHDVLAFTSVNRAKLVAVCVDDDSVAKKIIKNIRIINSTIPILVRTRDMCNYDELIEAGANHVIIETIEASLMLTLNMFAMLGVELDKAMEYINQSREAHNKFFTDLIMNK